MKQTIISIFFFVTVACSLTSCLKQSPINLDPSQSVNFLQMEWLKPGGTTINSGLPSFGVGALTFPGTDVSDTVTLFVAVDGPGTPTTKDVSVTVGPDFKANLDNYKVDSIKYENMPDSVYHLINSNVTVKAGANGAQTKVVFFPSKIDPTKNYAMPLTVTSASGYSVSSNFGHIYFHTIGNPLAGAYKWDYSRWNGADQTAPFQSASFTGHSTTWLPDNGTKVEVQSGYGAQNGFNVRYVITFTNNNGVLSNLKVVINQNDITGNLTPNGISLTGGPTIIAADLVNKKFHFSFQVNNGSAFRYLEDSYY